MAVEAQTQAQVARTVQAPQRREALLARMQPYLELMRLSNPVGSMMIYIPHLLGCLLALGIQRPHDALYKLLTANLVFVPASAMLHATGCSWNDIVDADLDRQVARTRSRPMARGAISLGNAYRFTALEAVVWLGLLYLLSLEAVLWSLPLIPATMLYPYAKRYTSYPSLTLGPIIAWGTILGFIAMDLNLVASQELPAYRVRGALLSLFAACSVHVSLMDMVYTHQDLKDDTKVGILSMARRFRDYPKRAMSIIAATHVWLLYMACSLVQFSSFWTTVACLVPLISDAWMIVAVDLADGAECWWWFQAGTMMTGPALTVGLLGQALG
ncbi:MAG: hypothetical protein M1821_009070 [Bathelium mastoideum]|nr:MAG: hypothetical protein M1821_009070 [Bathelium mastoideum]